MGTPHALRMRAGDSIDRWSYLDPPCVLEQVPWIRRVAGGFDSPYREDDEDQMEAVELRALSEWSSQTSFLYGLAWTKR